VEFRYDDNGNLAFQQDSEGNTVERYYSPANVVVREVAYRIPDPDLLGPQQPGEPEVTRYIYEEDPNGNPRQLRYTVSPEGRVSEYRYNAEGLLTATIQYRELYPGVPALAPEALLSEAELNTWVATQDPTQVIRTDQTYDFRGNLATVTTYQDIQSVDTNGEVISGSSQTKRYFYDQAGRLLFNIDPRGVALAESNDSASQQKRIELGYAADQSALTQLDREALSELYTTHYLYDGLGRLITSTTALDHSKTTTYLD
jgi:YD repeat-containing protein